MSVQLNYAARSDVGLVRSTNQDSGYAGPHLLVLADGMGGPAGGDIASSVAVAHLAPLDDDVHPADDLLDLLRDAVADAHDELMERSQEDHSPQDQDQGRFQIHFLEQPGILPGCRSEQNDNGDGVNGAS
ncbi:MAG: hypothetical protein LPK38_00335, partial [Actinomycetes bacterium]|nr:hypothetical protein [Actinomycetes bacterium]MDX5379771.1 hypothetical protein [Actinomycetes bacterium]MDX5398189.1 hypothetical protein [Actinomycetes bacterium]MDX5449465.1 hypothetical protein [Actinomycetes bacterium]